MSPSFNHIDLATQAAFGSCTTAILSDSAVTSQKINITGDISFNEHQALQLRIENVSSNPTPGNIGRLVWNTTLVGLYIDTGSVFEAVASAGSVSSVYSNSNPHLTGDIQFVSGSNITLSQVGNAITISSSATPALGNLTDAGTDGITITGGTGAVIGSGTSISQHVADSSHNGYLASSDWTSFSNKQPAGSYITALTGDVTASGPGSSVATLSSTAAVKSIHADSSVNLTGNVQLASGTNVTLSQIGQVIVINSTGGLSSSNFIVGEFPSGSINGINQNYTLAHTPVVNSDAIYLNGIRQYKGLGNDYTISSNVITFTVAPSTGSVLLADYIM